jgi:hypothetical protein
MPMHVYVCVAAASAAVEKHVAEMPDGEVIFDVSVT